MFLFLFAFNYQVEVEIPTKSKRHKFFSQLALNDLTLIPKGEIVISFICWKYFLFMPTDFTLFSAENYSL